MHYMFLTGLLLFGLAFWGVLLASAKKEALAKKPGTSPITGRGIKW